jgi:sec-independent protein translocase protein TatA
MFGIGDAELFIVAVVALLLFGNKLPSMMHSLGKSLSHFKRNMEDVREQVRKSVEESDEK